MLDNTRLNGIVYHENYLKRWFLLVGQLQDVIFVIGEINVKYTSKYIIQTYIHVLTTFII